MKSTPVGFEPTRGGPIGLAGRRLNRSAKVSMLQSDGKYALAYFASRRFVYRGKLARKLCYRRGAKASNLRLKAGGLQLEKLRRHLCWGSSLPCHSGWLR